MHLLIDVRTSNPRDALHIRYAEIWAHIWSSHFPHDRLTFLAYEGDPIEREDTILISRRWRPGRAKISHHAHGPSRIISFSPLAPLDHHIPTLSHLPDIAPLLYPRENLGWLEKYSREQGYRKLLRRSKHIIVPHHSLKESISDFFDISPSHISVIPLLMETGEKREKIWTLSWRWEREYIIVEGTPGSEWHAVELIKQYSHYIHNLNGKRQLVIIGDMGENLGHLSSLIRSFDLLPWIKLVWTPRERERTLLYDEASLFLALGPYPSRIYSLASALGRGLPSILSDLPIYSEYSDDRIHSHHIDFLSTKMKAMEDRMIKKNISSRNDTIIEAYKKLIAE